MVLLNASFSSTTYKTFTSVKIGAIQRDRFMAIPQELARGSFAVHMAQGWAAFACAGAAAAAVFLLLSPAGIG